MPEEAIQILAAVLVGGLIGIEREYRNKSAGLRTMVFICLGATIFTMLSSSIGGDAADPTRIASNIVTGVGFLGAGVILRNGGRVAGLTTASIIWLVAAIGMGIGYKSYMLTGIVSAVVLFVLWIIPTLEEKIETLHEFRSYTVTTSPENKKIEDVKATFRQCGVQVKSYTVSKTGGTVTSVWSTTGSHRNHTAAMEKLLDDEAVQTFQC
ncbi:MAG: MgtC/SapB family protein [Chloroflexota bacterium]|nr:MgtC/SapB family protein [Chloroflexota bacterium]